MLATPAFGSGHRASNESSFAIWKIDDMRLAKQVLMRTYSTIQWKGKDIVGIKKGDSFKINGLVYTGAAWARQLLIVCLKSATYSSKVSFNLSIFSLMV